LHPRSKSVETAIARIGSTFFDGEAYCLAGDSSKCFEHGHRGARPELKIGQALGVGHFSTLLAPAQINSMLEAFYRTQVP
jgi:hypothetical protein